MFIILANKLRKSKNSEKKQLALEISPQIPKTTLA